MCSDSFKIGLHWILAIFFFSYSIRVVNYLLNSLLLLKIWIKNVSLSSHMLWDLFLITISSLLPKFEFAVSFMVLDVLWSHTHPDKAYLSFCFVLLLIQVLQWSFFVGLGKNYNLRILALGGIIEKVLCLYTRRTFFVSCPWLAPSTLYFCHYKSQNTNAVNVVPTCIGICISFMILLCTYFSMKRKLCIWKANSLLTFLTVNPLRTVKCLSSWSLW